VLEKLTVPFAGEVVDVITKPWQESSLSFCNTDIKTGVSSGVTVSSSTATGTSFGLSLIVTVDKHWSEFPRSLVTVSTTVFAPKSSQSNSVISNDKETALQESKDPLSTSAATMETVLADPKVAETF